MSKANAGMAAMIPAIGRGTQVANALRPAMKLVIIDAQNKTWATLKSCPRQR
jgi:hypothetical protein